MKKLASGPSSTVMPQKSNDEELKKVKKQLKRDKNKLVAQDEQRKIREELLQKKSDESRTVIEDQLAKRIVEKFKSGQRKGEREGGE